MTARIIPLKVLHRDETGENTYPVLARLPPRVGARLRKIAEQWNISPNAAAEALLIDAINKSVGIKR